MSSPRRRSASKRKKPDTGSQKIGEPEFILVGIVRRPHGIKGEVLVEPRTDFPEALQKGIKLYLGEDRQQVTIRSRRDHKGILLAFEEFRSLEDWGSARNLLIFKRAEDSPKLPKGTYYHHQLIGINVISEDGESLGTLREILETGASAVYVIRGSGGEELLLPSVDEVIREIDLVKKQMVVRLQAG